MPHLSEHERSSAIGMLKARVCVSGVARYYTEQQKKRIFCIFGIVYKSGFNYSSNDM